MFTLKRFLLTILGLSIGFTLSLLGVMLPWQVRNTYIRMLAIVTKRVLQVDTFVEFVVDVAFSEAEISSVFKEGVTGLKESVEREE